MVMTYDQAREYGSLLQQEFSEEKVSAEVTGGLPEESTDEEESEADPHGDPWIHVDADILLEVANFLKNSPEHDLSFDSLHCLSGDHIPEKDVLAVVYHLYSFENEEWIILKTLVPEESPEVPSLTEIYPGANWHEREAYDMFGIRFTDHPDLRRILLPNDWDGHPLRKDYVFPQYYRGLPVDWAEARDNRMSRDDFYDEAQELEEMDIDSELGFTPRAHQNGNGA